MKRRLREVARFTTQPHVVARFYAGILGASPPEVEQDAYNFEVEGVNLFIHRSDEAAASQRASSLGGWPPGVDHIAFAVEDVDADCERLRAAGYEIDGPREFPWGRSAYLFDPDGRMVELHGHDVMYP